MDLRFFIDKFNAKDYKPTYQYVSLSSQTAYLRMGQDALQHDFAPIYVDTVVEEKWTRRWWCSRHWWNLLGCSHPNYSFVMCLDCDNENGMLSAARILKMNNIGYAVVKSSCASDKIENIGPSWGPGLGNIAIGPQGVQGTVQYVGPARVDHFWLITDYVAPMPHLVNFMRTIPGVDYQFIEYCARKQHMFLRAYPKYASLPVFPTDHTLVTKSAVEWYNAFKAHYESQKMKSVIMARKLRDVMKDPTEFNKLIHDPSFEV